MLLNADRSLLKMREIVLFVFLLANLYQLIDAKFKLNTLSHFVRPGSGFMNYIKHGEEEVIINCFLTYPLEKTNHTIEIFLDKPQDFSNAPAFGNRLSNLERNLCGIKVVDSREGDSPNMTLLAHYTTKGATEVHSYNATFRVSHYLAINIKHEVKEVELGVKLEISCGVQNVQRACTMFSPKGKIVTTGERKCEYKITFLTMDDIGTWICVPTFPQSMKPLEEYLELRLAKTSSISTWYTEENGVGKIGCQYISVGGKVELSSCEFVNPTNRRFHILMSSANERYTSIGTNFDEAICQIEFELPVAKEEIGSWKCLLESNKILTGGFIDVHPPNTRAVRSLGRARTTKKFVQIGRSFAVECSVRFSSTNCYILSPGGEYFYGGGQDNFNMGICTTKPMKATKDHLGTWICHFARDYANDDEIIQVEVVEEFHLAVESTDISAELGKGVSLMCEATAPILSCQFVGPDDMTYSLSPKKKTTNIHYTGPGFEFGVCGLRIESMREEHAGVWLCIVNRFGDDTTTSTNSLRLRTQDSPGVELIHGASAIGIPIGIMVVAILLLGVGLIRKFRKRSPTNSARQSDGSNTDIPIFDVQALSNYETTTNVN